MCYFIGMSLQIQEYLDTSGKSPFAKWFDDLNPDVAAKVTIAIVRMRRGLLGDVKPVGQGVSEHRIDYGPGYRVYFAKDDEKLVILLGGGSKKRQQHDIAEAIACWQQYKHRKQKE
jgi:putative addiction module killer protein